MERQQLHLIWSIAQGETAADYLRPQLAEKYRDCPCPAELLELRHLDSWTVAKSRQIRIDHWTPPATRTFPFTYLWQTTEDMVRFKVIRGTWSWNLGHLVTNLAGWSGGEPSLATFLKDVELQDGIGHNAFQIQQRICPCRDFCTSKLHSIHNILRYLPFWKRACFYAKQM